MSKIQQSVETHIDSLTQDEIEDILYNRRSHAKVRAWMKRTTNIFPTVPDAEHRRRQQQQTARKHALDDCLGIWTNERWPHVRVTKGYHQGKLTTLNIKYWEHDRSSRLAEMIADGIVKAWVEEGRIDPPAPTAT